MNIEVNDFENLGENSRKVKGIIFLGLNKKGSQLAPFSYYLSFDGV